MPYPASHRIEVRRRIIESARKLFNRHGFESVSVTQVMAGGRDKARLGLVGGFELARALFDLAF